MPQFLPNHTKLSKVIVKFFYNQTLSQTLSYSKHFRYVSWLLTNVTIYPKGDQTCGSIRAYTECFPNTPFLALTATDTQIVRYEVFASLKLSIAEFWLSFISNNIINEIVVFPVPVPAYEIDTLQGVFYNSIPELQPTYGNNGPSLFKVRHRRFSFSDDHFLHFFRSECIYERTS